MHHLTRSHWQRTDECVTSTVVSLPPFHTLAPRPSRSHFHLAPIGPSQASPSTHPNPQTSHLHPPLLGIRICNNIWLHSIHRTHLHSFVSFGCVSNPGKVVSAPKLRPVERVLTWSVLLTLKLCSLRRCNSLKSPQHFFPAHEKRWQGHNLGLFIDFDLRKGCI